VNALTDSGPTAQAPLHGNDVALQDMIRRIVPRGITVQTTKPANRNARTQTAYVLVSSASVRTKAKRMESTGVQGTDSATDRKKEPGHFPKAVDLTGQDEIGRATRKGAREGKPNVHAEAQTFTNAVTTILQTFN
jgi:hypothetical protein